MSRQKLDSLTDYELMAYVNIYLRTHSLNKFEQYHNGSPKGYIKHRLKRINAHYDSIDKQFYIEPTTTTNDKEVQPMEHTEQLQQDTTTTNNDVLLQIRDLLVSMDSNLGAINNRLEPMEQPQQPKQPQPMPQQTTYTASEIKSIDTIRPMKNVNEDLVIRNFKTYPSILNRLKRLTNDTGLQTQQVVSYILDEVLSSYGY